jgi:Predicted dioxygenase
MNAKKEQRQQYIREAYHAGSWYEDNPTHLDTTLTSFLSEAAAAGEDEQSSTGGGLGDPKIGRRMPRGVIVPHAGYRYSGPTAAYAYSSLLMEGLLNDASWSAGTTTTIVVLHPSHHEYLDGCAISGASWIKTPLGDLAVDESLRSELLATGEFSVMRKTTDEREHSGEMQYPFLQKIILDATTTIRKKQEQQEKKQGRDSTTTTTTTMPIRVLPIMVGAIHSAQEIHFGKVLAPYLSRPQVLTVISSDFCHWGRRFGYTPTSPPDHIKMNKSIKDIHEYVSTVGFRHLL